MCIEFKKHKTAILTLVVENERGFTGKEKSELHLHIISGSTRSIKYEGWNFNFGNTTLDWIQELLE